MKVFISYILVILIWSTTPLAIHISSDDLGFILSVTARMTLGAALVWACLLILRKPLFFNKDSWRLYLAASIGVFPNMPLVYWAAEKIPTGLISLLFSTSPFFVGLLSKIILKEKIGFHRIVGMAIAFVGMAVVFSDQVQFGPEAVAGIVAMVMSTFLFSTSAVLIKKLGVNSGPLEQSAGSMLFALPGLWITWFMLGAQTPAEIHWLPTLSLAYLVVVGSLVGFSVYFFLLKNLSASTVSLTSMISPIFAMFLGTFFNNELFNPLLIWGAAILLVGLGVYLGLVKRVMGFFVKKPPVESDITNSDEGSFTSDFAASKVK